MKMMRIMCYNPHKQPPKEDFWSNVVDNATLKQLWERVATRHLTETPYFVILFGFYTSWQLQGFHKKWHISDILAQ